ncbi:MAG: hypothetical protein ACT4O5_03675 [Gammaproteobacteria bacterium]
MTVDTVSVLRLRVVAEAHPGALSRVLDRFQNLNVLPRRVLAEFGTGDTVHIQVDIVGIPESTLSLIAGKLAQVPCVLESRWYRA